MGAVDRTVLIATAQRLLDEVEPQVHHAGRVCADEQAEAVALMAQDSLEEMRDGLDNASRNLDEEINLYEIRQRCDRIRTALPPLPESKPARHSVRERLKTAVIKTATQAAVAVAERVTARARAAVLGWEVVEGQEAHAGTLYYVTASRKENIPRAGTRGVSPRNQRIGLIYAQLMSADDRLIAVIERLLWSASEQQLREVERLLRNSL